VRGQIPHLVQEGHWFGVEVDGVADDLDAGPAHDMVCGQRAGHVSPPRS
jgi:hypothetical protein